MNEAEGYPLGQTIGSRIRKIRMEKGYTQDFVAERSGLSQASYFRLEANKFKRQPTDLIEQVAKVLGCTIDDLIIKDDELSHMPKYLRDFVTDPENLQDLERFFILWKYEKLQNKENG